MPTGHIFIATSLDGYIARPDHQLDWLMKHATEGDDHGYAAFTENMDGLVMGRRTYETVLTFGDWPYNLPVVVMSKTLSQSDVPEGLQGKVRVSELDPPDLFKSLAQDGWARAYIDGGKVIQSFLRCGLIEDLVVTTAPVLIGEGLRLFGEIDNDIDLKLIESKSFDSGMLQAHYRVIQNNPHNG